MARIPYFEGPLPITRPSADPPPTGTPGFLFGLGRPPPPTDPLDAYRDQLSQVQTYATHTKERLKMVKRIAEIDEANTTILNGVGWSSDTVNKVAELISEKEAAIKKLYDEEEQRKRNTVSACVQVHYAPYGFDVPLSHVHRIQTEESYVSRRAAVKKEYDAKILAVILAQQQTCSTN